jgi:hypothetical protein
LSRRGAGLESSSSGSPDSCVFPSNMRNSIITAVFARGRDEPPQPYPDEPPSSLGLVNGRLRSRRPPSGGMSRTAMVQDHRRRKGRQSALRTPTHHVSAISPSSGRLTGVRSFRQ